MQHSSKWKNANSSSPTSPPWTRVLIWFTWPISQFVTDLRTKQKRAGVSPFHPSVIQTVKVCLLIPPRLWADHCSQSNNGYLTWVVMHPNHGCSNSYQCVSSRCSLFTLTRPQITLSAFTINHLTISCNSSFNEKKSWSNWPWPISCETPSNYLFLPLYHRASMNPPPSSVLNKAHRGWPLLPSDTHVRLL